MINVFESLYLDRNRFYREFDKFIRKRYGKSYSDIFYKVFFIPYRLLRYSIGTIWKKILIDTASLHKISNPYNIVFLVRNDYLKKKIVKVDTSPGRLLEEAKISNKEIIDIFIDLRRRIYRELESLQPYSDEYIMRLAKYNIAHMYLGSIQNRDEMSKLEDKAMNRNRLLLLKMIVDDELELKNNINIILPEYNSIYMPVAFLRLDDKMLILDVSKKLFINKNLMALYSNDWMYRYWMMKLISY